MVHRIEACSTCGDVCCGEELCQLEATLTEISVAALTTEPELRDWARSLIWLARCHAQKRRHVPRSVASSNSTSGWQYAGNQLPHAHEKIPASWSVGAPCNLPRRAVALSLP
jgi:hypothetical protein